MKKTRKSLTLNLRHLITILENKTVNPVDLEDWQEKFLVFAEIIPVSENNFSTLEGLNFGHMITEAYFIFKIRFTEGINIKQKILFKNRNFDIKRIINDGELNRTMTVIALEV